MNKMVSTADLEREVVSAVPTMTRTEKLLRWAELIRKADPNQPFRLMSNLEHCHPLDLMHTVCHHATAFALAARDPILQDAGLVGKVLPPKVTVGEVMNFFELKQEELHEFSCDCGGAITNTDMANRIENIAHGRSDGPLGYVRNLFR